MIIWYDSLQDLPEFFEDNMATWMTHFHVLLTTDNKLLQTQVRSKSSGVALRLKILVCDSSLCDDQIKAAR